MEIELGKLFGYEMVLKDVPEERYEYVKKLATKHLDKLNEMYNKETFGAFRKDLEIAKTLLPNRATYKAHKH